MSNPVSTVLTSLEGAVLQVLARTTAPLTGSKVHQLAAVGSETGTRKVLRRLATTGLVSATEVGAAVQYTLNRDHLAAHAVMELVSLRQRLFDSISAAIETWQVKPDHASVFGSAARGDGDVDSDIDLLIIHGFGEDPTQERLDQVDDLADQVYRWSGNHLQAYTLDRPGFLQHIRADEPIVKDWRRDAVTVYGADFRTFMNALVRDEAGQ
ncbi:nucleotidyltransferase domain-containing protein [Kribbella yunnanensis]